MGEYTIKDKELTIIKKLIQEEYDIFTTREGFTGNIVKLQKIRKK